eukprot:14470241-Heterocapsa_arctica.AAC.1
MQSRRPLAAREAKNALAAPGDGKGAGKGKGKAPKPGGAASSGDGPPRICWYHNHGGCTKSAKYCTHEHKKVSKAEAEELYKPP